MGYRYSVFESELGVIGAAGPVKSLGVDMLGGSFGLTETSGVVEPGVVTDLWGMTPAPERLP